MVSLTGLISSLFHQYCGGSSSQEAGRVQLVLANVLLAKCLQGGRTLAFGKTMERSSSGDSMVSMSVAQKKCNCHMGSLQPRFWTTSLKYQIWVVLGPQLFPGAICLLSLHVWSPPLTSTVIIPLNTVVFNHFSLSHKVSMLWPLCVCVCICECAICICLF